MTIMYRQMIPGCGCQVKVRVETLWHHRRCYPVRKMLQTVASQFQLFTFQEFEQRHFILIQLIPVRIQRGQSFA